MPKFRVYYDDSDLDARCTEIVQAETSEEAGRKILKRDGKRVKIVKIKVAEEEVAGVVA